MSYVWRELVVGVMSYTLEANPCTKWQIRLLQYVLSDQPANQQTNRYKKQ